MVKECLRLMLVAGIVTTIGMALPHHSTGEEQKKTQDKATSKGSGSGEKSKEPPSSGEKSDKHELTPEWPCLPATGMCSTTPINYYHKVGCDGKGPAYWCEDRSGNCLCVRR